MVETRVDNMVNRRRVSVDVSFEKKERVGNVFVLIECHSMNIVLIN